MISSPSQQGFTLIEALVAVVVISIGLFGLLGLQTVAIVNTHVSKSQTLASIATDDIADRIRANPVADASLVYASITDNGTPSSEPEPDCSDVVCNPDDMAEYDAWEWQKTLARTLPKGRGNVSCALPASPSAASPCEVYDVTVLWLGQDKAAGSGSSDAGTCAISDGGSDPTLRCYAIEVQP